MVKDCVSCTDLARAFADDEQTAKRVAWNCERISTIALTGTIPIQTKHCAVIPQFMYRRHVYVDAAKVTPDFIENKWKVTQKAGARYGSAAFVTGGLDPAKVRSEFTDKFQQLAVPVMVVIAENAPPKSKAEMEALTELPGVESRVIPGSLGMHEENAEALANAVKSFI
jgi:hypothetical protein